MKAERLRKMEKTYVKKFSLDRDLKTGLFINLVPSRKMRRNKNRVEITNNFNNKKLKLKFCLISC